MFGAFAGDTCLSWEATAQLAESLGLTTVPMLYAGPWDEPGIRARWTGRSAFGDEGEGYVVRLAEAFPQAAFAGSVAKYVRHDLVRTDEHWLRQAFTPNELA